MSDAEDRPPGRPRVRGRKRGIALTLIAVLLVAGGVAAEQMTEPAVSTAPSPTEVAPATSGTAYCPVVGAEGDTAQIEVASASQTENSEIVITRYVDGEPVSDEPRVLEAGRSAVLDVPADQLDVPVAVGWRGGPVVVQYRLVDEVEQAVATCATRPSDRWYAAGFDTNRGNTSTLYLFNPFGQEAVVQLRFGTAEGRVDLVIADEITVPAGEVVVRDLAEFRPETADLAVSVIARAGRVVPQGQVVRGPAGEGLDAVTGRALVPATAVADEVLYVPGALVDDVTESWVTVYNPSERQAAVEVQVTTPLATASTLASEVTVPAGGTARIDLADLSALPRLGVRLESVNGIDLVATRTTAVRDGDRTGVALQAATSMTDRSWTVVGGRAPDGVVTLFNPGEEVATVEVDVTGDAPDGWAGVEVPPNALAELPLDGVDPEGPVLVRSDVPVVAGVVSLSPDTATGFWSVSGTSQAELVGGGQVIPPRRDPSLSSQPAISATATPTPTPLPDEGGEGQLDPAPTPSAVGTPTTTPTPSPGVTAMPTAAPEPTAEGRSPTPDAASPPPTGDPGPSPSPPATTEEGSLFG